MATVWNFNFTSNPFVIPIYGDPSERYELQNLGAGPLYITTQDKVNHQAADGSMAYVLLPGQSVSIPYPTLNDTVVPIVNSDPIYGNVAARAIAR